ncbi:MAG: hypothetical protein ACRDH6_06220 [Actinomycetota bacterium]
MDLAAGLIERHGWHVVAEVAIGAVFVSFGVVYLTQLVRGRARAVVCSSCRRVSSRAHAACPRCGAILDR